MSTLWTPSGEHRPEPEPEPQPPRAAPSGEGLGDEDLARLRHQLASTPVTDIIANHAIGLWQLAVLHLSLEGDTPPRLDEARLAIDAMAAIVEGVGADLGHHQAPLRDALAQLRLAFVEVSQRAQAGGDTGET